VQGEEQVAALLERNRRCLEVLVERLCEEPYELHGGGLRAIVREFACPGDLARLDAEAAAFL
jgi:hypothetical protein